MRSYKFGNITSDIPVSSRCQIDSNNFVVMRSRNNLRVIKYISLGYQLIDLLDFDSFVTKER